MTVFKNIMIWNAKIFQSASIHKSAEFAASSPRLFLQYDA